MEIFVFNEIYDKIKIIFKNIYIQNINLNSIEMFIKYKNIQQLKHKHDFNIYNINCHMSIENL